MKTIIKQYALSGACSLLMQKHIISKNINTEGKKRLNMGARVKLGRDLNIMQSDSEYPEGQKKKL